MRGWLRCLLALLAVITLSSANFYEEIDPDAIKVGDIRKWTSQLTPKDFKKHSDFVKTAYHSKQLAAVCEDREYNLFLMMDDQCKETLVDGTVIFICDFEYDIKAYNMFDCLPAY